MHKQIITFLIGFVLCFNQVAAQDFKQQFNDLVSKKDTLGQMQLLEKWEKTNSNDPELYVAYYNYYANKSMTDMITLGNKPKGEDVLEIKNKDTTKKEPLAYIYNDTYYDTKLLNKGFKYIDKGITKNPERLDMRFGKIFMYGKMGDYEHFTSEIIKAIDYSAVIKNKWTWADNKPVDDPKKFLLGNIQTYVLQIYDTQNDDLLVYMKKIAEAVLKYYPDHIESLSNLAIVYLINKEYDKALEPLLKAEKIDPKDCIVLNNIAQAYKLKGDNKNAIKYYGLAIKYGDDETKAYSKTQIEELKKK